MRAIIIKDEDVSGLLDQLELERFQQIAQPGLPSQNELVVKIHEKFHHIVSRWLQAQGANVVR